MSVKGVGTPILVAIVAVALILSSLTAVYYLFYRQTLDAPSVAKAFNGTYHISSYMCQSSPYLLASGISNACTEVIVPKAKASPDPTIVLFEYSFNSTASAASYIQNIAYNLNATPWPQGVSIATNISKMQNFTVYITNITFYSSNTYLVTTAYLLHNNKVLGISATGNMQASTYQELKGYVEKVLLAFSKQVA